METSLQLIALTEDTVCPYCQTTVKKGSCVCPSCHAEHARKRITFFHYVVGLTTAFCLVAALVFIVCSILAAILGLRGGGESFLYLLGALPRWSSEASPSGKAVSGSTLWGRRTGGGRVRRGGDARAAALRMAGGARSLSRRRG